MKVSIGDYATNPSKRKRLIKVTIDRYDTYSLDHTLALVISPALKRFKQEACSYPPCFESLEYWLLVIDKMIYAMDKVVEDQIYLSDDVYICVQEGCDLFGKYFQHLWW